MKNRITKILLISILTVFAFSSCEEDALYETNDPRDQIAATWLCQEDGGETFGQNDFEIDIAKDGDDESKIKIYNIFQLGDSKSVNATLDERTITIAQQSVSEWQISGTGDISSNYESIEFTYTVDNGELSGTISAFCSPYQIVK